MKYKLECCGNEKTVTAKNRDELLTAANEWVETLPEMQAGQKMNEELTLNNSQGVWFSQTTWDGAERCEKLIGLKWSPQTLMD